MPSPLPSASPAGDIRAIVPPQPYFLRGGILWLAVAAIALVLAGLVAWYLLRRPRKSKPTGPTVSPREAARLRLAELARRADELDARTFGGEVCDVLRAYITDEYRLQAQRQTSPEFLAAVASSRVFSSDEHRLLSEFLEGCDLLKFARADATPAGKRALLEQASEFVEGSRQEQPPSLPASVAAAADRFTTASAVAGVIGDGNRRPPLATAGPHPPTTMNWHDLAGFGFAQPQWLWLLALPVVLALRLGRAGGAPAVVYSSTATLAQIGQLRPARAGAFSGVLLALAGIAAVLAFARPQLSNTFTQVEASGIDIMIALDVSRSMLTEDFQIGGSRASRVDAIKEITQRFVDARPNDRIGMLAFAGRPYLVSPPTLDHAWLIDNLDRVKIGLVEDGTAIGSAIVSAANRLKNREAKSRIIVLLSDGDNNAGRVNPNTAAEAAKVLGLKVYTIGVGTNGIAPFPMTDPFGRTVYQDMHVEFDEQTLRDVAQVAGGHFFRADSSRALEEIYAQIDALEKSTVKTNKYREYRDLFGWFVGTSAACLGTYLALSQLLWRRLP